MRFLPVLLLAIALDTHRLQAQTAPDSGRKSSVGAGALSYFLPGVGSYYVGNHRHAAVHGSIAITLAVTGFVAEAGRCQHYCEGPTTGVGAVAYLGYITNAIWATVTAVHDANDHNAAIDRLHRTTLQFTPAVRIGSVATNDAVHHHVQVSVARLSF